ncbi:MAG: TetR/AcrR family transcriptional regulator [Reyranella sp.]|uniref:TetR/AcrR family transcriptional regulator n=1 Tax=Reyranella sp. TaxID=1929291 RepID=UPI003D0A9BA1
MNFVASIRPPQAPTAGRGDRVARTREAIIASALALALAGEVAPIVRDIAKTAGVSARTVFQHFSDTAELYVAVLGRMLAAVVGDLPDLGAAWSIEERIAAVTNQCSDRCERLLPMWTFVETLQRRSPNASDMVGQMYNSNRHQLAICFDRELTAMPPESRERALNALAVACAPEAWVVLRRRLGLSIDQARDELRFITSAVFSDGSARG